MTPDCIDRGTAIAKLTALEITEPRATLTDAKRLLADMPAAAGTAKWVRVEDGLPPVNRTALSNERVCVIAWDGTKVRPMIYERACIRGKTKYRWKWMWDAIYHGDPVVSWLPLPEAPGKAASRSAGKGRCGMTREEYYRREAYWICCPWCDEPKCVGRFNCPEIEQFVKKHMEEDK